MPFIRLINPNTSKATTAMMTSIAGTLLPADLAIEGMTASTGVPMIVTAAQLAAAAPGVVAMGSVAADGLRGIIISAFGDPGIEALRARTTVPVAGIFESSALEAAAGGRCFGIATVTPGLVDALAARAAGLGLAAQFTGTRLTEGDPEALAADPERLEDALAEVVDRCFTQDGAEAVIIGGGPLGQAAIGLARRFAAPVIAPIPAAVRHLLRGLGRTT